MNDGVFRKWLEMIDNLSEAQRDDIRRILAGRSSEAEVIAALEGGILADRCDLAVSTAWRWRHRFLEAIKTDAAPLRGIVEADETYVLESLKGSRVWQQAEQRQPDAAAPKRKPRKRGGKASKRGLSDEQVAILMATDRTGTTVSSVLSAVNANAIETVLSPVLNKDALLVSDGARVYPLCADKLGVSHETLNLSAGERVGATCISRP